MQFTVIAAAALSLVVGASAYGYSNETYDSYVTEVVTEYTTYCPAPTVIAHGDVTYTVTEATTLTITNCPCTVTKPIISVTSTHCPSCEIPTYAPPAPPAYTNATAPTVTYKPVGSTVPTKPAAPAYTGAANKAFAASGVSLAGLLGLAAYIL